MGLYIITKSIAINTSHNNLHRGFALKNILLELYQIVGNGGFMFLRFTTFVGLEIYDFILLNYVYLGTFLFCCLRVIGLYTVIWCISLLCYKLQY
jgi:hypothetical protein